MLGSNIYGCHGYISLCLADTAFLMSASGAFTPTPRTSPVEMDGPGWMVKTVKTTTKKTKKLCTAVGVFRKASLLC